MTSFRLSPVLCRRVVLLGMLIPALASGVAPAAAPAETRGASSAAIGGKGGHAPRPEEARSVRLAIATIDVRLQRCYAENKPTGPPVVAACNDKATDALEKLLRPSRQREFEAFLQDLFPPLYHFLTKDGAGQSSMEGVIVATFRDVARKRSAILSGADTRPARRRVGHPSLDQLLGKLHGDPLLYQFHYERHLQRHWKMVRTGDCAAHLVPHCAARLDAALADELDTALSAK